MTVIIITKTSTGYQLTVNKQITNIAQLPLNKQRVVTTMINRYESELSCKSATKWTR